MEKAEELTKVTLAKSNHRHEAMRRSIELLNFNPVRGKEVVLKPNFNTADPYPGSTHPESLKELIVYLRELGAQKITIGERSGPVDSAEVIETLGINRIAEELGVEVVNFDQLQPEELVKVDPPRSHWQDGFLVPRMIKKAECVVAMPCLKTHQFGGVFTMALKLAVGIVPKADNNYMGELHRSPNMGAMIAEINTGYHPDLIVMDAMEAFVEQGPMTGKRKQAGLFVAGTDRIAIDAVGLAILIELGSTPEIMNKPIFMQEQIARAVELGLGVNSAEKIELITGDAESASYAEKIRSILDSQ
jgi:uncharacterized protein (DUF362 family)